MVKSNRVVQCTPDTCDVRVVHLERVARARTEAIGDKDLDQLALTYKIMGDPTRLKILLALSQGEMCVCDLAAFLGISESAVSHQLRYLRQLNLVVNRREGTVLYYRLCDSLIIDLIEKALGTPAK